MGLISDHREGHKIFTGGTKRGIYIMIVKLIFIFHLFVFICESGLRTISTARTRSHREVVFLCLKSSIYLSFPLYLVPQYQPTSTYIYQQMLVYVMVFPVR